MIKDLKDKENLLILIEEKKSVRRDIINEISEINMSMDRMNERMSFNKTRLKVVENEIKLLNNYVACDN